MPDPNTSTGTFAWAPVRELDSDQVTVRVDQNLNSSHRIFGRYSWHDQRMDDPNAYPALGTAPLSTRGQNVVLSMTNTLSSSLLHEARFSYVPAEAQKQVRFVLSVLPWRQSALLILRHEGLSYLELAATLQMNPGSVGTLLARAQQAFRKEFGNRYGDA